MIEFFKEIEGYPNYEVSNLGTVRNRATGNVLRPGKTNRGYHKVHLYKEGQCKILTIHRLVAAAFLPNPENKREVNHIDGDKTNNRVSNLEWSTRSENVSHAFRNGLAKITDKHNFKTNHPSIKKRQKVRCIETSQEFESQCDAAKYFNCRPASISNSLLKGHSVHKKYHFGLC